MTPESEALASHGVAALAKVLELSEIELRQRLSKRGRIGAEDRAIRRGRDECLVALREAGLTLDAIGAEWGITRERVRMIVAESGGPTAADVSEARRAEVERQMHMDQQWVADLLASRSFDDVEMVVEALGWEPQRVEAVLTRKMKALLTQGNHGRSRWTRSDILGKLQAAAEIHGVRGTDTPLTGSMYDEVKDDLDGPSRPKISMVFGSWSAALREAGLVAGQGPRQRSRFSDSDLIGFVIAYLADPHVKAHTFDGYDHWRTVHEPAAPSGAFIRVRLGPWSQVRAEAYTRAVGEGKIDPKVLTGDHDDAMGRDLSEHELAAADQVLEQVRTSGGNPADPADYERFRTPDAPDSHALREAFGSWGLALGALGWDPGEFQRSPTRPTDEEAIRQLADYAQTFFEQTGFPPSAADWEAERPPNGSVGPWSYSRRFGGWRQALIAAGIPEEDLPLRLGSRRATIDLTKLMAAVDSAGGQLTADEWDKNRSPSSPSAAVLAREFGGWRAAVDAAKAARG